MIVNFPGHGEYFAEALTVYGQDSKTTTTGARVGLALATDGLLVLHLAGHEETDQDG